MATLTMLRDIASELPDVREGTHFGMVAFSVAGKGFISVTKDGTVQLLMGPDETERALAAHPTARPIERRGRPIGIGLPLADVDVDALRSLVRASYAGSA